MIRAADDNEVMQQDTDLAWIRMIGKSRSQRTRYPALASAVQDVSEYHFRRSAGTGYPGDVDKC